MISRHCIFNFQLIVICTGIIKDSESVQIIWLKCVTSGIKPCSGSNSKVCYWFQMLILMLSETSPAFVWGMVSWCELWIIKSEINAKTTAKLIHESTEIYLCKWNVKNLMTVNIWHSPLCSNIGSCLTCIISNIWWFEVCQQAMHFRQILVCFLVLIRRVHLSYWNSVPFRKFYY